MADQSGMLRFPGKTSCQMQQQEDTCQYPKTVDCFSQASSKAQQPDLLEAPSRLIKQQPQPFSLCLLAYCECCDVGSLGHWRFCCQLGRFVPHSRSPAVCNHEVCRTSAEYSLKALSLKVAWYFRKPLFACLGDIFGCVPKKTHAVQSAKDLEQGLKPVLSCLGCLKCRISRAPCRLIMLESSPFSCRIGASNFKLEVLPLVVQVRSM